MLNCHRALRLPEQVGCVGHLLTFFFIKQKRRAAKTAATPRRDAEHSQRTLMEEIALQTARRVRGR